MKKILIDTGVFIALFNTKDRYHQKALDFIKKKGYIHFTTEAVITEVLYIFHERLDIKTDFLDLISKSSLNIFTFDNQEYSLIKELITTYADLPMDYADATVVRACEKLQTAYVASTDGDFGIYRLKGKSKFINTIELF